MFVVVALLTAACSGSLTVTSAAADHASDAMPMVDELEREARAAAEGSDDTAMTETAHEDEHAAEAKPVALRRLQGKEINAALVRQANRIIREHYRQPIGTDVPFEIEGRKYVGRIEQHYHPEGGALRPWGFHKGCSLFAVEG